jgi:adenylate cyclase
LLEAARDALPVAEPAREYLAAAYAYRGDQRLAKREASSLLRLFPASNLTYYGYLYDYWREEDRRRHLEGLREAGITEWPFGFEGRDADRLDAVQLGALVDNKTWIGKHHNGTEFLQYFDRAGNTAYRSANTNITGTVEVEEDGLCQSFEGYFLNRRMCGYVYRTTGWGTGSWDGLRDADSVHVTPDGLMCFSLAER